MVTFWFFSPLGCASKVVLDYNMRRTEKRFICFFSKGVCLYSLLTLGFVKSYFWEIGVRRYFFRFFRWILLVWNKKHINSLQTLDWTTGTSTVVLFCNFYIMVAIFHYVYSVIIPQEKIVREGTLFKSIFLLSLHRIKNGTNDRGRSYWQPNGNHLQKLTRKRTIYRIKWKNLSWQTLQRSWKYWEEQAHLIPTKEFNMCTLTP